MAQPAFKTPMVATIDETDMSPGALARLFRAGHSAVVVHCREVVGQMWSDLLEHPGEQLPWEASLVDLARNCHGGGDITMALGDVFYFQPGHHGYIARKIEIEQAADGALQPVPRSFVQKGECFVIPPATIDRCWDLGRRLLRSLTPIGSPPPDARITVQRLKYQPSIGDYDALFSATANALGRWGRLGARIDRQRADARGPLRSKRLSDIYAMTSLIPGLKRGVRTINAASARRDRISEVQHDHRVIEGPHFDHRYFSALCGQRSNMVTQMFVNGAWTDLPIGMDHLVVIPGELAARNLGLPRVLHRVVHTGPQSTGAEGGSDINGRTGDVTLLFGAV
jgi:hypothetical protein